MTESSQYDVAHVFAGLDKVAPALTNVPAVFSAIDAWHLNRAASTRVAPRLLRPLYRLEERRVQRYESHALRPYRYVVTVTSEDAAALRAMDPTLRLVVIPNGVDAEAFAPGAEGECETGHVVFTGVMDYGPNVEAAQFLAQEILPRVRRNRSDAYLSLVGRNPSAVVRKLAELDGVRVTGEVPDVRPWLRRAEVYACPMVSGTGIKNKLLEALACGAACVATPLACRGLNVVDDEHLLVSEDAEGLARAVFRLLEDASLRRRLGDAGRRYVLEHHTWEATAAAYERLYEQAASA